MNLPPIIAVDFDGCLVENCWPKIGEPNRVHFHTLCKRQRNGAKIILWTCRAGAALQEAVQFCHELGLDFDAINENIPEVVEKFGGDTRKIYAHEYWDDRAKTVKAFGR